MQSVYIVNVGNGNFLIYRFDPQDKRIIKKITTALMMHINHGLISGSEAEKIYANFLVSLGKYLDKHGLELH